MRRTTAWPFSTPRSPAVCSHRRRPAGRCCKIRLEQVTVPTYSGNSSTPLTRPRQVMRGGYRAAPILGATCCSIRALPWTTPVASAVSTNVASTKWEAPSIDTAGVDVCRSSLATVNVSTNTKIIPDTAKGHTRRALHGANTAPARRMVTTDALQSVGGVTGTIVATSASSGTPIWPPSLLGPLFCRRKLRPHRETYGYRPDWWSAPQLGRRDYRWPRRLQRLPITVTGATKSKINSGVVATSTFAGHLWDAGGPPILCSNGREHRGRYPESDHSNEASAVPAAGGGG